MTILLCCVSLHSTHMTLWPLGECCNQIKIQYNGPAILDGPPYYPDILDGQDGNPYYLWWILGDYELFGNDGNVYKNVMDDGSFLHKLDTHTGLRWVVCTDWQYILLHLFNVVYFMSF